MRSLKMMLFIGFLIVAGVVGAQTSMPSPCDVTEFPLGWELDDDICKLKEVVSVEGSASYPYEVAEKSLFAQAVMMEYISQEQYNFWKLMQDTTVRPDDRFHNYAINSYEIKYELFWHSETIASVMFLRLSFPGGGRGNPTYQAFTFDLENNKLLNLEDIFLEGIDPYSTIAPHARDELLKQWPSSGDKIVRTTVPTSENYALWALKDSSLLIYFYGSDVTGGMAVTSVVAEIPLEDLKDYLRPEFVPDR
jgi:hypothetical protein